MSAPTRNLIELCTIALTDAKVLFAIAAWANKQYDEDARSLFPERLDKVRKKAIEEVAHVKLGNMPLFQLRESSKAMQGGLAHQPVSVQSSFRGRFFSEEESNVEQGQYSGLMFSAIGLLAENCLELARGEICLRHDRLEQTQVLLGDIAIVQLWSYAVGVKCLRGDINLGSPRNLSSTRLRELFCGPLVPLSSDIGLDELRAKGLPELHRHLNGSMLPGVLWTDCLRNPKKIFRHVSSNESFRYSGLSGKELFRFLGVAKQLRACLLFMIFQGLESGEFLCDGGWSGVILETLGLLSDGSAAFGRLPDSCYAEYSISPIDKALELPGALSGVGIGERAFLSHAFAWLAQPRNGVAGEDLREMFEAGLHAYLLIQNLVRRELVQPRKNTEGLERFVENFSQAIVRETVEGASNIEMRLLQAYNTGSVQQLELRITPSTQTASKIAAVLQVAQQRKIYSKKSGSNTRTFQKKLKKAALGKRRPMFKDLDQCDPSQDLPGLGFVLHFIRRDLREYDQASTLMTLPRFAKLRARNWREARNVLNAIYDSSVGPYILGLDVAGNESTVPNEVFAPVIRYLRKAVRHLTAEKAHNLTNYKNGLKPLRSLACTCHAGEDFHHILSGMRAVDEAVEYFALEAGDRIGHGLAIGIDPELWAKRTGSTVMVTCMEWLDDLVWFHEQICRHKGFHDVVRDLNLLIREYSEYIYEGSEYVTDPNTLYCAWLMRSVEPQESRRNSLSFVRASSVDVHDFLTRDYENAQKRYGKDAEKLFLAYHFDPQVRKRSSYMREVYVNPEWFDAIRAVQDQMVLDLTERRIAIEVNPTSNLAIGGMDDLMEHPIFRWLPPESLQDPGAKNPFIVIGTDDPGIFATELIHEYAFLARAAERRGASPRQIWAWLEDLRSTGYKFSFFKSPHS